jgi:hypothetical protein
MARDSPERRVKAFLLEPFAIDASGVGKYPEALASVGRTSSGSGKNSPATVIPQLGQVPEYSAKPSTSEHWRVFHERETGSYFANDSGHFQPEAGAFAVDSFAGSCCGYVLAGKAARYHVNNSAPRSAVKGADVIPYRERRENPVVLSL